MFLHPLGLLALVGIPVVLGLHLFRRRYREQAVSALFLWEPQDRSPAAGRRRDRLRNNASLLAELLAVLCLALALGGLRGCTPRSVEHLVIVIDGSASMAAAGPIGSGLERTRDTAAKRIKKLRPDAVVSLIRSGVHPQLLAGPVALQKEALQALRTFEPDQVHHDLGPAIALANQLGPTQPVLVLTDHFLPDAYPPEIELISIGEALPNLAIVSATRTDDGTGQDEIRLGVSNYGESQVHSRLDIGWLDSKGMVQRRGLPLLMESGATKSFALQVPALAGAVHAQLPEDSLAIDNEAFLAPRPSREVHLATTLDPETLAALGLGRDGSLNKWIGLLGAAREVDPSQAHLLLTDVPSPDPTCWSLVVPKLAKGEPQPTYAGPYLLDRSSPVLKGMTLDGVAWSPSTGAHTSGIPLVSAGNHTLMTEADQGGEYFLNLDPARSSLVRSPDWPILLTNLAEMRRDALPGPLRSNLILGEPLIFQHSSPATYVLTGPSGAAEVHGRRGLVIDAPSKAGIYTLQRKADGQQPAGVPTTITWSFVDASESDTAGRMAGQSVPKSTDLLAAGVAPTRGTIEIVLILLALALGLFDWLVLSRTAS